MIRVFTIYNNNAQSLANDINYYIYKHQQYNIISINYVYNSYAELYTAFITYEEEEE